MQINYYNTYNSKITIEYEAAYINQTILFADKVLFDSTIPYFIELIDRLPGFTDENVIDAYKNKFKNHQEALDYADVVKDSMPTIKKFKKLKSKSKYEIVMIARFNKIIGEFKEELIKANKHLLNHLDLLELLPFIKEEVLEVYASNCDGFENLEHKFIQEIAHTLKGDDQIIMLDATIEEMFTHNRIPSNGNAVADFIKIPLCDFPIIKGLSFQQIKYTRDDLCPALAPIKAGILELREKIKDLSFSEKNIPEIEQMCNEFIFPHRASVQHAIDESLYLSKLKNQFSEKLNLILYLGISTAENIITFYEKAGVFPPYVANETKQYLSKSADLNASYLFVYFKPPQFENMISYIRQVIKDTNIKA